MLIFPKNFQNSFCMFFEMNTPSCVPHLLSIDKSWCIQLRHFVWNDDFRMSISSNQTQVMFPKVGNICLSPFDVATYNCWIIFTCLIHLFFLYPIYNNLVLQGLPLLEHMFFILLTSGYYYNHVDWSNQWFQFCKSTIEMFCKETLTP
jgi:hypothetical protein